MIDQPPAFRADLVLERAIPFGIGQFRFPSDRGLSRSKKPGLLKAWPCPHPSETSLSAELDVKAAPLPVPADTPCVDFPKSRRARPSGNIARAFTMADFASSQVMIAGGPCMKPT